MPNKSAQSNLGRGPRRGAVAHIRRKVAIGYNGTPQIRPQKYPCACTNPQTPLPASSLDPSDLWSQTASGSNPPFFHNALDRPTDARRYKPTDRPRESLTTIGRCATRATRPNNGTSVQTYQYMQMEKLDSLRWFSQRRSPTPHFWGCAPRGLSAPKSNSVEIFVQCSHPQVSSSYVYSFRSYHVDKQTNKQTNRRRWKHPTLFATLRRWGSVGVLMVLLVLWILSIKLIDWLEWKT